MYIRDNYIFEPINYLCILYHRHTLSLKDYLPGDPKLNFLGVGSFCPAGKISPFSLVREESEHQSGIDGSRM